MRTDNHLCELNRRDVLKLTAAGVSSLSLSGWFNVMAQGAAAQNVKHKACILLAIPQSVV